MLSQLWRGSAPLTLTALVMLPVLAAAVAGLALDSRIITGAPAWLKPAKFAASIAIYSATLAWIFSLVPEWTKTRRVVGWMTAVVLLLEMAIIAGQASRGTASHFNVATPLDAALFTIMGTAIVVQTVSSVAVAVALWRHPFTDRALGWALRLGMTITIAGAASGGPMTAPTQDQLDAVRAGGRMVAAGAHTVGAPDGGPGVAVTGWSTQHGDLRVPHFVGLHAVQTLPMVALLLGRRRMSGVMRVRLIGVAASSYAALFGILLAQALRGQSIVVPDAFTVTLLAVWALVTAAAAAAATRRPVHARSLAAV